jgi:hypothetical protein
MIRSMVMECKNGRTGLDMRDNGLRERLKALENITLLMETITKVNFPTINSTGKEPTSIQQALSILASGRMMCNSDRELTNGQTEMPLKGSFGLAKSADMGSSLGKTTAITLGVG